MMFLYTVCRLRTMVLSAKRFDLLWPRNANAMSLVSNLIDIALQMH